MYRFVSVLIAACAAAPVIADENAAASLFEQQRYAEARPHLLDALAASPADKQLRFALATVQFDSGELNQAWETLAPALSAPSYDAAMLAGQINTAKRDYAGAEPWFRKAESLAASDAQRRNATLALSHTLIRTQNQAGLQDLSGARGSTDDVSNQFLNQLRARSGGGQDPIRAEIGYRFEHDSNVPSAPQNLFIPGGTARKSDIRHVLFGDLIARHDINDQWSAFGEAHISRGWHEKLDELDYQSVNLVGSIGWSGDQLGVRVPVEYNHLSIDGDTFNSIWSIAPGLVFKPVERTQAFAYVRFEDRDYNDATFASEDRSGDAATLGLTLRWESASADTGLRVIIEHGNEDADGRNWQRDLLRLFARVDQRITQKIKLAAGAEIIDYDYDQVHDAFFVTRDDRLRSAFVALSYAFAPHWSAHMSAVFLDNRSNIELYDYDRHVLSAGVSWHY